MEWLTVEVFDEASAAWLWRDQYGDVLVPPPAPAGARYWEWHEHRYGVAFEAAFLSDAALRAFRDAIAVRFALEHAPDPAGVLVYRGRGGGSGSLVLRRPQR